MNVNSSKGVNIPLIHFDVNYDFSEPRDLPRLPGSTKLHRTSNVRRKSGHSRNCSMSSTLSSFTADDEVRSGTTTTSSSSTNLEPPSAFPQERLGRSSNMFVQHRRYTSDGAFDLSGSLYRSPVSAAIPAEQLQQSPSYETDAKDPSSTTTNSSYNTAEPLTSSTPPPDKLMATNTTRSPRIAEPVPARPTNMKLSRAASMMSAVGRSPFQTSRFRQRPQSAYYHTHTRISSCVTHPPPSFLADEVDNSLMTPNARAGPLRPYSDEIGTHSSQSFSDETTRFFNDRTDSDEVRKKRQRRRANLIKELITTEAAYLSDLNAVDECYKSRVPLCSALNSIETSVVFQDLDSLIAFTVVFYNSLLVHGQGAWAVSATGELDPQPCDIGLVFLEYITDINLLYSRICSRQDAMFRIIKKWRERPEISQWISEGDKIAQKKTNAWDLGSLLIKPLQRLMKYPLLLKKIIDVTAEDSPERPNLLAAFRALQETVSQINQRQRPSHKRGSLSTSSAFSKRDLSWHNLYKPASARSRTNLAKHDQELDPQKDILRALRVKFLSIRTLQATFVNWVAELKQQILTLAGTLSNFEQLSTLNGSEEAPIAWRRLRLHADIMASGAVPQLKNTLCTTVTEPLTKLLQNIGKLSAYISVSATPFPLEPLQKTVELIDRSYERIVGAFISALRDFYATWFEGLSLLVTVATPDADVTVVENVNNVHEIALAFEPKHYEMDVQVQKIVHLLKEA
ncbi:RhoGEF Gef1 [Schizosaccharomyces japonicus yFS275]|uniref:RhoGEF Gef1 n=1 Tax=Schizosaccharomyces japonicus (strain yFS275 / FY16936) TaxID=402676 RepID=B6K4L9_SCHJY|nr:RhoGEF Gef1 [Schizosaccharomyces japonicus yFS275]EEB08426.1 RhoGEF Gef1 [Schizosaccharomyces japonicus yFS275]